MRKITAGELCKILKEHKRWLDTDEDEGERADLSRADLINADLSGADLINADLSGADLEKADLSRADLSEVLGLNIEQLSTVQTLYKAKLDPELMDQVEDEYPHLLEHPLNK
jgi:hypothetical protein